MENMLEQEAVASGLSFRRVGECLYQNPGSGTYYAVVRLNGKQSKSSLETKSLPEARRKLRDYRKDLNRLDPAQARLSVKELCDKFLATVTHQAAGSSYRTSFQNSGTLEQRLVFRRYSCDQTVGFAFSGCDLHIMMCATICHKSITF